MRQHEHGRPTRHQQACAARLSTLAAGGPLSLGGPIFGLLSALSWGTGDFAGGLISRFSSVFVAIMASEAVGLLLGLVLAIAAGEPVSSTNSIAWSALAGACGVAGLGAFYYALSRGTMGVVAPLSALIGAGLPVLVGVISGEAIDGGRGAGMALALTAVVLISLPGGERTSDERRLVRIDVHQLPSVLIAGLGFGLFFVFLSHATTNGETWWPIVIVRVVGFVITISAVLVVAARARERTWKRRLDVTLGLPRLRARAVPLGVAVPVVLVCGLGDLGGNGFFVLATRADALSVAVVLSSLYPVVTALLAALFLHERLRPLQIVGVVLASLSVPLLR
ncbi:MAG TPA: EamA family transporter [Candidatus Limnocylindrales bacterium]